MVSQLPEGTVTVLFTDAVGSAALAATAGDAAARARMRVCEQLVRDELARHAGLEVKGTGDAERDDCLRRQLSPTESGKVSVPPRDFS